MNSILLNENSIRHIVSEVLSSILNESLDERNLTGKKKALVRAAAEDAARAAYGEDYGKRNNLHSRLYGVDVNNDVDIASGLFSIGNQKLSDDTLIINFTSALGCPSVKVCPITQKACYAVAGENRLPMVRRKNIIVQNLWKKAVHNGTVDKVFYVAELYIKLLKDTKKPIRFIRYNEAGDFSSQKLLDAAAEFSKRMLKEYGVMSMAYTANRRLNFTKEIGGTPIANIIKINASRNDIVLPDNVTRQHFFGIPMDFNKLLANNDKAEEISDSAANRLKCRGTVKGKNGFNSVPLLTYGTWNGGSGWYYVCPCSFWKYNKDKAEETFYANLGLVNKGVTLDYNQRMALRKTLTPQQSKELKSILNKIKSPCGTECAVCHDMDGGLTPNGEHIRDYAVLTATHGSGKGNYDAAYANAKRGGNDNVAWQGNKNNPHGLETKYREKYRQNNNNNDEAKAEVENNI